MKIDETNTEQFPDLGTALIDSPPNIGNIIGHLLKEVPSMPFSLQELAKNGRVVDEIMELYLQDDSESSSLCKEILQTELHYKYAKERTFKEEKEKHFELGTFAHAAFLEPERFDNYIIEPPCALNSFEGIKPAIDFWVDLYKGDARFDFSSIASPPEKPKLDDLKKYLNAMRMNSPLMAIDAKSKKIIDAVKANYYSYAGGILPKLLRHSLREVSFYGSDKETGMKVKVRPDGLQLAKNIGVNAVISFKTTGATSIDNFIYDTMKFKYELSEGMYQEVLSDITGKDFNVTLMVMLQTVPPYLPALFIWDNDDIERGKKMYHESLAKIKKCKASGKYSGFDTFADDDNKGIITLKQPIN